MDVQDSRFLRLFGMWFSIEEITTAAMQWNPGIFALYTRIPLHPSAMLSGSQP